MTTLHYILSLLVFFVAMALMVGFIIGVFIALDALVIWWKDSSRG